MEKIDNFLATIKEGVITYGPKVVYAIIILIVGLMVIKSLTKIFTRMLKKREIDDSLVGFLRSLFNITLKVLLVVSIIGMVGIQTTSFIAVIGAAGLAVGMALSGMLQNFAGGVIILILKPFKVGDFISALGESGIVQEIQIFNTILKTPDNKKVFIPNGGLATGAMVNFTAEETRRVDLTVGIGYGDDIDKAKSVLMGIISKNNLIQKDPEPFVGVIELGDSSVNFVVRVWAKTSEYWNVFFYLQENVKKQFDAKGVSIPFPQRDVHLYTTEKN